MSTLPIRVSFFLGAGASAAFNYPTTEGFLRQLNDTDSIKNQEFWESSVTKLRSISENTNRQFDIEVLLEELKDYENFKY